MKDAVVPYIGTWIETREYAKEPCRKTVVPYIGTWIETIIGNITLQSISVVPYIGTWIETFLEVSALILLGRTLYRYVD